MTGAEFLTKLKIKVSEQNDPGWYPQEYEAFVNEAALEFVQEWSHKFEQDETARRKLDALIRRMDVDMEGRVVNAFVLKIEDPDTLEDRMLRITSITGVWGFSCRDNSKVTKRELPIVPLPRDSVAQMVYDPYNYPTNMFPRYVEDENGGSSTAGIVISIKADTIPEKVTVHYLEKPRYIHLYKRDDADQEDARALQFRDEVLYEVMERIVRKIKNITGDQEGYQAALQVETPIKKN